MSPGAEREAGELNRTILIVDDAPMFRELESVFLARTGRVVTASSGDEALVAARTEHPDVIVADFTMPGMGGHDLCIKVKRDPDLRRIPVIIVTSGVAAEDHERAVRSGADDVLEKPVSRVSLIQAVNRFLRTTVRGLMRVPLETDVRMGVDHEQVWAWSRNLSRGGIYLEAESALEPETELQLEFQLPAIRDAIAPSARVVWRRVSTTTNRAGMGLQFLKLDRDAAQVIDEYVYEHTGVDSEASAISA